MKGSKTSLVKYVFLDIVAYTRNRSVEAQSDLISQLNTAVTTALEDLEINTDEVILLPTGDGICIALIALIEPYDIHIKLAQRILLLIQDYNESTINEMRKFQVRIGINENVDNLVTDVNGRQNVAGLGINMAQRIMDRADGGQILVGQTVFEQLRGRENYMSAFRQFNATAKHGTSFSVYQFVDENSQGLNIKIPESFKIKKHKAPLTDMLAYYLSYAITYFDFFIKRKEDLHLIYAGPIILFLLAQDSIAQTEMTPYDDAQYRTKTWKVNEASFSEIWDHYCAIDFVVLTEFSGLIEEMYLDTISDCFEKRRSLPSYIFVNERGKQRLKEERPDLWSKITPS